jgi:hypothetical protein
MKMYINYCPNRDENFIPYHEHSTHRHHQARPPTGGPWGKFHPIAHERKPAQRLEQRFGRRSGSR